MIKIQPIMKRTIFIVFAIVFLSVPHNGRGQHQYYFNEGDTIYGRDTTYHYQWWSEQWLASDSLHQLAVVSSAGITGVGEGIHGRIARYCYTEQPLNVVGIATTLYTYNTQLDGSLSPIDTAPIKQEYLLLYEADSSRNPFYEVGRIPFDYNKHPRYMNLDLRGNHPSGFGCCGLAPNTSYTVPIREFYFYKPITVYDSFYVGHTQNTNPWPDPEVTEIPGDPTFRWCVGSWAIVYLGPYYSVCPPNDTCESTPFHQYRLKMDGIPFSNVFFTDTLWHYLPSHHFMLDFPIIEVDSSFYDGPPQYVCPKVENFRIAQADADRVVMLWDTHGDHQYWQISYGPSGTAPEEGTIVNCPIQVGQIMNIDTCTDYVVYIRAVCHHDSIVYSEWSDSIVVNVCDTTSGGGDTEGIDRTPGQFVMLFPNPATEQVQIFSSFDIKSIEVYDLQGRSMVQQKGEGHAGVFSVDGWQPGLYIAVVHTPAGNFAKKLMVK